MSDRLRLKHIPIEDALSALEGAVDWLPGNQLPQPVIEWIDAAVRVSAINGDLVLLRHYFENVVEEYTDHGVRETAAAEDVIADEDTSA